ncbi:hypothetical protein RR11_525 [Ruegeria sp. R11]|nr:hypothetical protein RR11_525 [Ruegeria sp. R11]
MRLKTGPALPLAHRVDEQKTEKSIRGFTLVQNRGRRGLVPCKPA